MSIEEKQPESALAEVVKSWRASCLEDNNDPLKAEKDLEADAKIFFRYLSKSTSVEIAESNLKLETRSSHEEALVKLIQELGPAFTSSHHQSRVRGLHVLSGAIGGCADALLSNRTTSLLGKFLIGHCGPIEDDEYGEDFDSMIRDAAVSALGALTQTAAGETTDQGLFEALTMRLQFSRQAIERRCAAPDEDSEMSAYGSSSSNNNNNNNNRHTQDIRGGLSALTRSKRAICFAVIGSTAAGIATMTKEADQLPEDIIDRAQPHLVEYARFASNCIHGESDPRCLLQLLLILHEVQLTFSPWFQSSTTPDSVFPADDMFDAVSPYYPIQFTPPPNDIHRITRYDLHRALINVLNYTKMDENSISHNRHSMLGLSVGLYVEQMVPMEGEESSSTVERQEALDCLAELLFPNNESESESLCNLLDVPGTRNLYVALESTHAESSLAVASGIGFQREQSKRLADDCRTLVSKIAYQLEIAPNRKLFYAFVSEPLQKQARKIKLSPSHAKTSIAYIACLAASGRSRTLRLCLSTGLDPLLENLGEGQLKDEEDVTAAAHGVGAFFSSCRVATERAKEKGVALHPHPLEPYTEKAYQLLLGAFDDKELSTSPKIGIVRALESLIISCPKTDMESNDETRMSSFVEKLLEITVAETTEEDDEAETDWKMVCSSALGSIVGTALDLEIGESTEETDAPFLSNATIHSFIKEQIYSAMLESALKDSMGRQADRLDRRALATACNFSETTAKSVTSLLLENLCAAIKQDIFNPSCVTSAETLSYMLAHGGDKCRRAYHDNPASDALLTTIGHSGGKQTKPSLRISVANLALPTTEEEKVKLKSEVNSSSILLRTDPWRAKKRR
jgi:hypothetical protein